MGLARVIFRPCKEDTYAVVEGVGLEQVEHHMQILVASIVEFCG
jgi:hypothetical protein